MPKMLIKSLALTFSLFFSTSFLYANNKTYSANLKFAYYTQSTHFNENTLTMSIKHLQKTLAPIKIQLKIYHSSGLLKADLNDKKLDFLLTDATQYLQLQKQYNLRRIANLNTGQPKFLSSNRSITLIARKTNSKLSTVISLKGKKLAIPGINFSEEWWILRSLLKRNKIDIFKDLKAIRNIRKSVDIVHAVIAGQYDVGVLAAGELEKLVSLKLIDLESIKILNKQVNKNYPLLHSAALYSGMIISSTRKHDSTINLQTSIALLNFQANNVHRWVLPIDLKNTYTLYDFILQHNIKEKTSFFSSFTMWNIVSLALISILSSIITYLVIIYRKSLHGSILVQRQFDQLKDINHSLLQSDDITQLSTRNFLDTSLQQEWGRACRDQKPISAIIFDANISDDILIRNKQLQSIANCIHEIFKRSIDIKAHYGKNEFLIILPNTDSEETKNMAKNLRHSLNEVLQNSNTSSSCDKPVQIGVATLIPEKSSIPDSLIAAADNSLRDNLDLVTDKTKVASIAL